MTLPHLKPIKFVDNIIEENDIFKIVSCKFPYIPTIGMASEAAAQSSAAFASFDVKKTKVGLLVSLTNIEILMDLKDKEFTIKIVKGLSFGTMTEFRFELIKNEKVFVRGTFVITFSDER